MSGLRVATFNVDWALTAGRVDVDLDRLAAEHDVLMLQETKNVDVAALLGAGWQVWQSLTRDDQQGTAVAWRTALTDGSHGRVLGVKPGRAKMLARWITWVLIDGVVYASAHRPPARYRFLWPAFDAAIRAFAARLGAVVIGMDSNTHNHAQLSAATGLTVLGPAGSIDVFLVAGVSLSPPRALSKGNSDHHAVSSTVVGTAPRRPAPARRVPRAPVLHPWAKRSRRWIRRHRLLWRRILAWRKKHPR